MKDHLTLQQEAQRVDPSVDGWDSEAFHERALAQLKNLSVWQPCVVSA